MTYSFQESPFFINAGYLFDAIEKNQTAQKSDVFFFRTNFAEPRGLNLPIICELFKNNQA